MVFARTVFALTWLVIKCTMQDVWKKITGKNKIEQTINDNKGLDKWVHDYFNGEVPLVMIEDSRRNNETKFGRK